jgi:hypothetical protein
MLTPIDLSQAVSGFVQPATKPLQQTGKIDPQIFTQSPNSETGDHQFQPNRLKLLWQLAR